MLSILEANPRTRWWGLVVISLGVSLIIVDSTIVNVAVPSIIDDIGITSTQAQWVQEIYTLVFAALLLVFGRLADTFGRRRLFMIGATVFGLSSVLAAVAQSGGTLTTSFSWRWAFGINIPLCVIVIVGLGLLVSESKDPSRSGRVDVVGALLSALGFGGVVFGLIEGRTYGWFTSLTPLTIGSWSWPWSLSPVPVAMVVGVAALVVFVLLERRKQRRGEAGMLDLALFAIPSFRNGNIAAAIVSLGEFGIIFALPLWLQNVIGYTAFETGLVLLALASGSFLASGLGALLGRTRPPVFIVRLGIVLEIVGIASIGLFIRPESGWLAIAPPLFVYGIGVGFATAQLTGVALADVPVERSGQASGTQSTARQVGSAFGIAILGTVLFSVLGTQFEASLADTSVPEAEQVQLVTSVKQSAGSVIPALAAHPETAEVATLSKEALTDATRWSALTAAGFLVVGLVASLSLGQGRREESEDTDDRGGVAADRNLGS